MPRPLGVPERLYPQDMPEEIQRARLQAAAAGLMARGLVAATNTDTQIQVDPILTALAGAVTLAEMLVVSTSRRGGQWTYYLASNLALAHRLPSNGIHRFVMTNTRPALIDLIADNLALGDGADFPPVQVAQSVLEAAAQAGNANATQQQLTAAGLSAPVAAALTQPGYGGLNLLSARGEGEARQLVGVASIALYPLENGLVSVETLDAAPGVVNIYAGTRANIMSVLSENLAAVAG
jgi:hypothetical protein